MAYYLDFEGGTSSNEDVLIPEIYVNATEDFRFEIDFLTPSTNIINVLLGRSVSAGSNYALLWDNGEYSIRLSSTDSTRRGGITPNTRHKIVFRRENGVMYSSLDGAAETNDGSVAVLGRFDLIGYIGTSPTNRHFKGGLYDIKFYRGETLERHYNPTSSGGTGSVLPCDVASANDGTLRSFDGTADSWWIFYSEGGAGVTATGSFNSPTLTASGSGSATLPQPVATGAFSSPLITASGAASATLPQPIANGSVTMPFNLVNGTASASSTANTAAGNVVMPLASVSGTAAASLPQPIITGAFSLPKLTTTATATASLPQPIVTGAFILPVLNVSGSGGVTLPQPIATGAFNIPILSASGSATVSGLEFVIDSGTNIEQIQLSTNIAQGVKSANITQIESSNNITYN